MGAAPSCEAVWLYSCQQAGRLCHWGAGEKMPEISLEARPPRTRCRRPEALALDPPSALLETPQARWATQASRHACGPCSQSFTLGATLFGIG
jgi:hypothetical protein